MLFGTSGIRGIYGKYITEELAYKIANVFAHESIVIGRDTRKSGLTLENACADGVIDNRNHVSLLGIVPTPTLALATVKIKCPGIMITASHNPSEYNGFKLFEKGKEISRSDEKWFEQKFNKWVEPAEKGEESIYMGEDGGGEYFCARKDLKIDVYAIHERGSFGYTSKNPIQDHKEMIKKLIDCAVIAKRKPKIVVDCNGAASTVTPYLLRELGCHVISVNCELEGFNRASEPNAENLARTAAMVKAVGADLGIAHDGDGDRCVVIDETGNVLPLDVQLAIMVEYEAGSYWSLAGSQLPKAKSQKPIIISTVEASLIVRETCERAGADIKITPVGSVYISEELEKTSALFGGEPCGEYIFGSAGHHAPDGVLAAVKFVEIFAKHGKLSELRKKYKQYPMIREKFKCEKKDKYEAIREIIKKININGTRTEDDGLRVDEKDGWFLIRASGTEPIIRLTMEYKNKKKLEERASELRRMIRIFIS